MRGNRWGAGVVGGALALCAAAAPVSAQSAPVQPADGAQAKPRGCDTEVIDFILPGKFGEALARARTLNRPLVIKGVAFGIDQTGATCATKGHW